MRRALAQSAALLFALAGSLAAHQVAYALAGSSTASHGYLSLVPAALAALIALLAVALAGEVAAGRRGAAPIGVSPRIALVPVLAFVVQEHLERLAAGEPALTAAFEPTFVLGLALQIPFGLAAWLLARLLLRAAFAAGCSLLRPQRVRRASSRAVPLVAIVLPRLAPLASGCAGRAPPGS